MVCETQPSGGLRISPPYSHFVRIFRCTPKNCPIFVPKQMSHHYLACPFVGNLCPYFPSRQCSRSQQKLADLWRPGLESLEFLWTPDGIWSDVLYFICSELGLGLKRKCIFQFSWKCENGTIFAKCREISFAKIFVFAKISQKIFVKWKIH
jgi:hypothetical protein